jgi:hypothetical protein
MRMERARFIQIQHERVTLGQRYLANTARGLVLRRDPDLYDLQSDAPDAFFLEPMLFAYFSASEPRMGLPQVVMGHLPEDVRPEALPVRSNDAGCVYLPEIGYYHTDAPGRELTLRYDPDPLRSALFDGPRQVASRFEPIHRLGDTGIELCLHSNPLLDGILTNGTPATGPVPLEARPERYAGALERALATIAEASPEFYRELSRTVRQIVLFRSTELNSCAGVSAHGVAFLNLALGDTEAFFADDLTHQGGHVVFNAFTAQRRDFLRIDPETPIGDLTGGPERRSVYTVFHGVYTEIMMIETLRAVDELGLLGGELAHEVLGRLACIFQKSRIDRKNLDREGLFTDLGQMIFDHFKEATDSVSHARPDLGLYDMRGQPYNFDLGLFTRRNPARRTAEQASPPAP